MAKQRHKYRNPGGSFTASAKEANGKWERFDPMTGVREGRCYFRKPTGLHSVLCFRTEAGHVAR
jgi:hypothetical protein